MKRTPRKKKKLKVHLPPALLDDAVPLLAMDLINPHQFFKPF